MSLILDALKKLEQEKAARMPGTVRVSNEILRENKRARRKSAPYSLANPWVLLPAVLLVALIAAIRYPVSHKSSSSGSMAAVPEGVPGQGSTLPAKQDRPFPAVGSTSARGGEAVSPATAEMTAQAVYPAKRENKTNEDGSPPRDTLRSKADENLSVTARQAGRDLVVSGIAWQEARAARRAVINGALVGEGAVIGNVKVVEIFEYRVRFSSNGEKFDVPISTQLPVK